MKLKLSELKLQSFVTSLEEAHKRTVVGGDDCPPGYQSWEGTGPGSPSGTTGAYNCNGCPQNGGTVDTNCSCAPCATAANATCPSPTSPNATCVTPGSSYCNPASGGYGCSGAATGYACNVQHC